MSRYSRRFSQADGAARRPASHLAAWLLLFTGAFVAGPAAADPVPITLGSNATWSPESAADFPDASFSLDLRRFAKLPDQGPAVPRPLGVRTIPGDDRLFVVAERLGNVLIEVAPDGSSAANLFSISPPGMRNLRDIVFHPQFSEAGTPGYGKLYALAAMRKPDDGTGLPYLGDPTPDNGDNVLAEYTATFDALGKINGIDAGSYREVMRVAQFRGDHPIGQGSFNPFANPGDEDYGLLYFTIGDSFQGSPVAQNGQSGLGKTFRIDPLPSGDAPFSVPNSNPFVGDDAIFDEIYTIGHRNPHSLSFAKDDQGAAHVLVAEIGENRSEEINLISNGGGNYGWGEREGTLLRPEGIEDPGFIYPVAQYGHNAGDPHAIAGGYVVDNGSALDGQYVFGDFPTSGDLFSFELQDALGAVTVGELDDLTPLEIARVPVFFDDDDDPSTDSVATTVREIITGDPDYDGSGRLDIRFGQGQGGELYLLNKRNGWMYLVTNSLAPDADFDGDGLIDGADLTQWEGDFGQNGESDADRDGDSDGADLLHWQRQLTPPSLANATLAPEPTSGVLALLTVALGFLRRRRLTSTNAWVRRRIDSARADNRGAALRSGAFN